MNEEQTEQQEQSYSSAMMYPTSDPVRIDEVGSWWFADEVWAHEYGPFSTEEECRAKLTKYCEEFLGLPKSPHER